jgi:hypothetical protein
MTYMVRTGRKVVVGGLAAALVIAGLWTAARQWGRPASGPQSSIIAQMDVAKTFES